MNIIYFYLLIRRVRPFPNQLNGFRSLDSQRVIHDYREVENPDEHKEGDFFIGDDDMGDKTNSTTTEEVAETEDFPKIGQSFIITLLWVHRASLF